MSSTETKPTNKFGLSKKTNIVIAGVAALAAVQESRDAIIAIGVMVLVGVTYQFILDRSKK
jgi:hypothetical protein